MWTLALSRFRSLRSVQRQLVQERERAQRLEITCRRIQLAHDELAQDLLRLSERLSRVEGRNLGGRRAPPAEASAQLPLSEIAPGDKQALRRALAPRLHAVKE